MSDWVDYIQMVRANNNRHWMDILRLALKHAPDEAKAILREIRANDIRISEATGELANADSGQEDWTHPSSVHHR